MQIPNSKAPCLNSMGIDEEIIQEEMEWIREMKLQSTNNAKDLNMNSNNFEVINDEKLEHAELNWTEYNNSKSEESSNNNEESIFQDKRSNTIANHLGLEDSIFHEEMEWVREMKLQNDATNNVSPSSSIEKVNSVQPVCDKRHEVEANQKKEKHIANLKLTNAAHNQKVSRNSTNGSGIINEEFHKTKSETTNGYHISNSLGLDQSCFDEEMEWIREMKAQSSNIQEPDQTPVASFTTKTNSHDQENDIPECGKKLINKENLAIMELEKQVQERIANAKLEESIKMKQQKVKEESELLLRIQEEMKLAEEMKQMADEENRLKIEEEERRKIAEQKSIEESERKKRKQEELDMITKLEELVKMKLTSSKG